MTISVWILKLIKAPTTFVTKLMLGCFCWLFILILIKIIFINPKYNELDYSNANFKVLGLNLPSKLEFAGERVPLNDYEIKENLEKEFFGNKSWKSSSLILFQKAQKWFPIIEPILKKEGIPDDFKYVAVIESHLSNVVSPMGAAGFWQLMPATAQGYGLLVNTEVDERYDVEKATYVACKHFKDGYNYFKNWTLSAAAYNVGIGGIQKALKKQGSDNYYDLLLNKETGSFVYRILAFKTVLANPEHFGIKHKLKKTGGYPPYKTVKVDTSITNLDAFAKYLETNSVTLKTFNAWLLGDKLTNTDNHTYIFKIPKNKDVDLSLYFNDVFPQVVATDSTITLLADTTIIKTDTLKKQ